MDKERSVDYWANEGGKRIEFVALANGDVRINFNTLDGRTYESLTLASYRYASVVEAIGKFHKGNTMNNKELTELKKEFIEVIRKNTSFDGLSLHTENVWKWLEPHLKSNDEIKREAIKEYTEKLYDFAKEDDGQGIMIVYMTKVALFMFMDKYLTQQSLDKGDKGKQ